MKSTTHRGRSAAYLLLSIPAVGSLVLALIIMTCAVYAIASGRGAPPAKYSLSYWMCVTVIVATCVQWALYTAWVLLSKQLSVRYKTAWIIAIIIGNMLIMPYLLYCMYKRDLVTGLKRIIGHQRLLAWLEKEEPRA